MYTLYKVHMHPQILSAKYLEIYNVTPYLPLNTLHFWQKRPTFKNFRTVCRNACESCCNTGFSAKTPVIGKKKLTFYLFTRYLRITCFPACVAHVPAKHPRNVFSISGKRDLHSIYVRTTILLKICESFVKYPHFPQKQPYLSGRPTCRDLYAYFHTIPVNHDVTSSKRKFTWHVFM